MKCIFIYNPVSGKGKIIKKLNLIVNKLKKKYQVVDVQATQGTGDMARIAHDAVGKYDAIIFSGGDGSFNEVVNGIADFDELPALGYIPSGTVNDIAHTLKIPTSIKKALEVIQTGKVEKIDCMKVNDRYAIYVVAAGMFTEASYSTPQLQKNQIGRIAYGIEGIKRNLTFEEFDIVCQEGNLKQHYDDCALITFMNGRYVSGFNLNKTSCLQDGKIEVAIVRRKMKSNIFQKIGGFFTVAGLFLFGYKAKLRRIIHMEGSSFDVEAADNIVWTVDGERGANGSIHVEVVPQKLNIIVPQSFQC